ncbi:MAG: N-formylglutamate amidohydrolase, partial [Spirochaetales bacterium]|nr:N-formylglutamate amidohydrolase [Candidatus Physcosoma equi]
MAVSLILHIPHASTVIPWEDENAFLPRFVPERWDEIRGLHKTEREERKKSIQEELLAMTDWYADELFDHGLGIVVSSPVSRLVCDMERFFHEEEEPMAAKGMGFCYTHGSKGTPIKEVSREYQDDVLFRYYAPHHLTLEETVETEILGGEGDGVLILDCHSFSPEPLPYEHDQTTPRPD